MPVDVEQLLVNFLRNNPDVFALVADRVFTDLPHDRVNAYPCLLVTRTGGGYIYKRFLDAPEVTVSSYGGTHKLAQQIAGTVITAFDSSLVGGHPEGVVTKVSVGTITYEPEPDSADPSGHARPRFTLACTVITHPG